MPSSQPFDSLFYVGLSRDNRSLGRAAWFFVSLAIARLVSLLVVGVLSGSLQYLMPVIGYVIPTAMLGDATMIGTFILLERTQPQLPAVARILITALATTLVTFAVQALRQSLPDALAISFAVGVLFPALFLGGLHVLRMRPLYTLAISMLGAVFIGSVVGDALTFVKLHGGVDQLPRLLASAIMVLEHGAVFTAVTWALMFRREAA